MPSLHIIPGTIAFVVTALFFTVVPLTVSSEANIGNDSLNTNVYAADLTSTYEFQLADGDRKIITIELDESQYFVYTVSLSTPGEVTVYLLDDVGLVDYQSFSEPVPLQGPFLVSYTSGIMSDFNASESCKYHIVVENNCGQSVHVTIESNVSLMGAFWDDISAIAYLCLGVLAIVIIAVFFVIILASRHKKNIGTDDDGQNARYGLDDFLNIDSSGETEGDLSRYEPDESPYDEPYKREGFLRRR